MKKTLLGAIAGIGLAGAVGLAENYTNYVPRAISTTSSNTVEITYLTSQDPSDSYILQGRTNLLEGAWENLTEPQEGIYAPDSSFEVPANYDSQFFQVMQITTNAPVVNTNVVSEASE